MLIIVSEAHDSHDLNISEKDFIARMELCLRTPEEVENDCPAVAGCV